MTAVEGLLFFTGPFYGGPVLAVVATAVITSYKARPRWTTLAMGATLMLFAVSFVAYWYLWGKAFDALDAMRPVPAGVDVAQNVAMAVCSLSALALVALAVATVAVTRRADA